MPEDALPEIDYDHFSAVEIRAGVVRSASSFPEARKPAIKLEVDFGPEIGVRQSSAQLTRHYRPEELVGTEVLAVVNLPPRRVAGFRSEVLILGVVNPEDPGEVVLVRPARAGTQGWRLA
jgi:tRNA-binding protein